MKNPSKGLFDAVTYNRVKASVGILALCGLAAVPRVAKADSTTKAIEFIASESTTPYFLREYDGIKQEAAKYGYTTSYEAPLDASDVRGEIGMVDTAVTRGAAGIILVPSNPSALIPPTDKAMAQHVPVVLTDSTLSPMKGLTFISVADDKAAGAVAAWAANLVHGKGQYAIIDYNLTTTSGRMRRDGFIAGMAGFPGMTDAGLQLSNNVPQTAMQETTTMLERNPNINVVFGANDRSALGVAEAVQRLHLENKVVVVGFDADLGEVNLIKSGVIKASVLQSPVTMGKTAVDVLHDSFENPSKTFPSFVPLPFTIVTYKNFGTPASISAINQYIGDYRG